MQRGSYVIALSGEAVEGGLVVRGEAQPAFAQSVLWPGEAEAAEDQPRLVLQSFLEQAAWERGWAVLVLPTGQVSYRRLHFEFADPKKIRQVLPFELENELLDGLDSYVYDAEIVPRPENGADVHVYLVEKGLLQACTATLEQYQLSVQRATFSAHALVEASPATERSHFYVYAGNDETYVAHAVDGRLRAIHNVEPHPGALLGELKALGPGSPHDWLQALFREGGEETETREALRERLRERMDAVREEVNRFVRVNSAGEPFALSLHGVFGELLEWGEGASGVSLRFPQGAWPGGRRTHVGVLDELLRAPRALTGRGLNFHHRVATWLALARDLRWPLVAAGVLLALLAALGGTGYFLQTQALQARLAQTDQQLRRTLGLSGPVTTVTVNSAMSRVQERLERLRKDRQAVAYLDRYHYDALKLFRDLSEVMAQQPGVTVDALSYNTERFTLSGTTPGYRESEELRTRIAAMDRFKGNEVKVTNSNVGQTIRYRLTVER